MDNLHKNNIFRLKHDQNIFISAQGLQKILTLYDPKVPGKNVLWTCDYNIQLPIRIKKTGISSEIPVTLIEQFQRVVKESPTLPALSQKINNHWFTLNYEQYYQQCINFGKSLIDMNLHLNVINIIGFNAPQWHISFFGSLFARCLPVGIYSTNSKQTCSYIAINSQCKLVIAENYLLASKYFDLLKKNIIRCIVIYHKSQIIRESFDGRVILWKDFLARGKKVQQKILLERMESVKPGNCCTLVYTSGTTGMPKGVMLSHDSYTWLKKTAQLRRQRLTNDPKPFSIVSYLPLSHVAAQIQDITSAMQTASHVYFAEPDALQGSLIKTLQEVRPTIFFSVPRVWEKIEEKIKQKSATNGWLTSKIAMWAKSIGAQETIKQLQGKETSWQFKLAKKLIYSKVKEAIGLDRSQFFIFGAAPLAPETRQFFLSLNIFLTNIYGMSQCSGPQTMSQKNFFKNDKMFLKQAGTGLEGTQLKIQLSNPNDEEGEICYRGRNIFMGYYKNEQQTSKTIDNNGYLHSGDLGWVDQNGVLFITGRLKQLLITAAGENIPPVLIQNEIKQKNQQISNIMLIGDNKRFLSALVTLKTEIDGKLWNLPYYKKIGSNSKTPQQAKSDPIIFKAIKQSIDKANEKAISRAQKVQTFAILSQDFTVDNGLLTPTLKLKRKEVLKKYAAIIDGFYKQAKL